MFVLISLYKLTLYTLTAAWVVAEKQENTKWQSLIDLGWRGEDERNRHKHSDRPTYHAGNEIKQHALKMACGLAYCDD